MPTTCMFSKDSHSCNQCILKNIWYTRTVTKPSSSMDEKDTKARGCTLDTWLVLSVSLPSGNPVSGPIAEALSGCSKGQLLSQGHTGTEGDWYTKTGKEIISEARTTNDTWGSKRQHAGWSLQDGVGSVDRRQLAGSAPKTSVNAYQWSQCKGRTELQRSRGAEQRG